MITYTKGKLQELIADVIGGTTDTALLAEIATKIFGESVTWNDETQLFEEH
jgi:hypothetical protein